MGQLKNVQTYLDTINNNLSTLDISGGMGIRYKCVYQGATLHCKKVIAFPVPSRDVTNHCNQTLPGWDNSRPGRVCLVTFRLGTGKTITFFTLYLYLSGPFLRDRNFSDGRESNPGLQAGALTTELHRTNVLVGC